MKKLFPICMILLLLLLPATAHAMDFTPEEGANTLYELGLFQGKGTTANGRPIYALNDTPTRAEAVTMLVRLLGREQEAKAGAWDLPFTDVPEWARPYVGYAYANGLTNGIGADRFGSGQAVTADQYMTFLLRALGYSSETDFAWNAAADYGAGLGLKIADRKAFTRGQVAAVSAAALAQKQKGSALTLAALLQQNGAIDGALAAEYGFLIPGIPLGANGNRVTLQTADGRYLAPAGRKLTLSDTPFVWQPDRGPAGAMILQLGGENSLRLDVENAWFSAGNAVSLCENTGSDAQLWTLSATEEGGWQLLCATHPELGLSEDFQLCKSSQAAAWQVQCVGTDRAKYFETDSADGAVTLQAEYRVLDLISRQRLQKLANDLSTAYGDYAELTGWKPYDRVYYKMYETIPEGYWGYATSTDTLHIDSDCIYADIRDNLSRRKNDWNFGLLHEMSHLFDMDKPWEFHAEVVCDYRLAYTVTKNNAAAVPADWYGAREYTGWEILEVYLGDGPLSETLTVFSLTRKLVEITKQIGWEAAMEMFRNYPSQVPDSPRAQLELFIDQLGKAGGIDARALFTPAEWANAMKIGEL